MRSALLAALLIFMVAGPSYGQNPYPATPEAFVQKMMYAHASAPYTRITAKLVSEASLKGQIFIFPVGGTCTIDGQGIFALNAGKLVIKAAELQLVCTGILAFARNEIDKKFREYFTIPDAEKLVRDEGQEFAVVSGPEADALVQVGFIEPFAEGSVLLLGANRGLVDFYLSRHPEKSRREVIFLLQRREKALLAFRERQEARDEFTPGALSSRVDLHWETGKFLGLALQYPFGPQKVTVEHALFENRWVWEKVEISVYAQDYNATIRVIARLSEYKLEP